MNLPFIILNYMGSFVNSTQSFFPYGMHLTAVFRKNRVILSLEKQISHVDQSIWITDITLHQMKLRLVNGVWTKTDNLKGKRSEASASSCTESAAASNDVLEMLRSMQLKQDQHFEQLKNLVNNRAQELETKVDSEFLEIHQRLNTITSQLNQIQEQTMPED